MVLEGHLDLGLLASEAVTQCISVIQSAPPPNRPVRCTSLRQPRTPLQFPFPPGACEGNQQPLEPVQLQSPRDEKLKIKAYLKRLKGGGII